MSSYKLLTYRAGKVARAGILVGETVYDAQKITGVAAYETVLGALAEWPKAKKAFALAERAITSGKSRAKGQPLKKTKLLAPVLFPGDIFAPAPITPTTWPKWRVSPASRRDRT